MFVLCESGARAPGPQSEGEDAYRPIVRLIRLHGDSGALALGEVVRIVHVLETAGTHDGVNVRANLEGQLVHIMTSPWLRCLPCWGL